MTVIAGTGGYLALSLAVGVAYFGWLIVRTLADRDLHRMSSEWLERQRRGRA